MLTDNVNQNRIQFFDLVIDKMDKSVHEFILTGRRATEPDYKIGPWYFYVKENHRVHRWLESNGFIRRGHEWYLDTRGTGGSICDETRIVVEPTYYIEKCKLEDELKRDKPSYRLLASRILNEKDQKNYYFNEVRELASELLKKKRQGRRLNVLHAVGHVVLFLYGSGMGVEILTKLLS